MNIKDIVIARRGWVFLLGLILAWVAIGCSTGESEEDDSDTDTHSDTDADSDSDTDTDTDSNSDTDTDTETDTDTDTDTALFADDFEDGDYSGWRHENLAVSVAIDTDLAADGTTSSVHITGGDASHRGLFHSYDAMQPKNISYWARSGSRFLSDTYFALHGTDEPATGNQIALIFFRSTGLIVAVNSKGQPEEITWYSENVWYHIELRDFDWVNHHFDVYVDGTLELENFAFKMNHDATGRVDLYNFSTTLSTDPQGWWDEFVFTN